MVFTNEGLKMMIFYSLVSTNAPTSVSLHLFQNDVMPAITNSSSNSPFTEFMGNNYSPITIPSSAWSFAIDANNVLSATMADQTFNFTADGTGPVTAYGYYITINYGSYQYIFCADRFSQPITISHTGDKITVGVVLYPANGA